MTDNTFHLNLDNSKLHQKRIEKKNQNPEQKPAIKPLDVFRQQYHSNMKKYHEDMMKEEIPKILDGKNNEENQKKEKIFATLYEKEEKGLNRYKELSEASKLYVGAKFYADKATLNEEEKQKEYEKCRNDLHIWRERAKTANIQSEIIQQSEQKYEEALKNYRQAMKIHGDLSNLLKKSENDLKRAIDVGKVAASEFKDATHKVSLLAKLEKAEFIENSIKVLEEQKNNKDITSLYNKLQVIKYWIHDSEHNSEKYDIDRLYNDINYIAQKKYELQRDNELVKYRINSKVEFIEELKNFRENIKGIARENNQPYPSHLDQVVVNVKIETSTLNHEKLEKYDNDSLEARKEFDDNKSLLQEEMIELETLKTIKQEIISSNKRKKNRDIKNAKQNINAKVDDIIGNMKNAFFLGMYHIENESKSLALAMQKYQEDTKDYEYSFKSIEPIVNEKLQLAKENNKKVLADLRSELNNI